MHIPIHQTKQYRKKFRIQWHYYQHIGAIIHWDVDIGGQECLPLPHNLMHTMSGIAKTLVKLTFSPLSINEQANIDRLVHDILVQPKSSERSNFPELILHVALLI